MAGVERVVDAFGTLGEAGKATGAPDVPERLEAARDYLVGVALMADIPDDRVAGSGKHPVQRQRQLDNAQVRGKMATVGGDGADDEATDFSCQAVQFPDRQATQIVRPADAFKD